MIMKTSTSPLDAIKGVLAFRRQTYAVEHNLEYWVWALAVSSAALSCRIHELVTTLVSHSKANRSNLEPGHHNPYLDSRGP
jgi:hypothetical protein